MKIYEIDGAGLKRMIVAGSNELTRHKNMIDELNVFPVPDGDTGTNMSLTVYVAAKEAQKVESNFACDVAKAASGGSLRGARGNSGVILSQLFRGFAKGLETKKVITTEDLANGFRKASQTAYKAVMKPKEGTILTVATALADKAEEVCYETKDIAKFMEIVINHGKVVLGKTTQMLAELKAANVVDAGGKGLICILEGAYNSLSETGEITLKSAQDASEQQATTQSTFASRGTANIEFGYCTEFFINVKDAEKYEDEIKNHLETIGDSIVVACDDDIVKIHVHTEHPGGVLEFALTIGTLSNMKIENMREQHSNLISFGSDTIIAQPKKDANEFVVELAEEIGFIAIASGDGLKELFEGLGVNFVILGGQTMNPSTEDILAAISKVNAKSIIILPNNKNIILAAEQAKIMAEGKEIFVLPTTTIPQGITAMVEYLPVNSAQENFDKMKDAINNVKSGQLTYAVRATNWNGQEIENGDILCILEGEIVSVQKDVQEGAKVLIEKMLEDGGDLVSVYHGIDVSEDDANEIFEYISENHKDIEVEVRNGGQPLYYYIFSVE